MKEAVDKYVTLRISTSDYRMYMSDLRPDWEKPDEDDVEDVPGPQKVAHNGMDLGAILSQSGVQT